MINQYSVTYDFPTSMDMMVYDDERIVLLDSVRALPDDAQLLEFGCGGSTLHYAALLKPTQHLTSVEHNGDWYAKVQNELHALGLADRVTMIFVPLPTVGFATPEEEVVLPNSEVYLNPPVEWSKLRWVLVDGIMRTTCLLNILPKLTPGTTVFLHDYVGREDWYRAGVSAYPCVPELTHTLCRLTV